MSASPVARVLIDSPLPQLDRLFDYAVPDRLLDAAQPGLRVRVPLRGRIADGWLVELAATSEVPGELAELEQVVSTLPALDPGALRLARRLADRLAGTASDVLRLAIPRRQARVEQAVAALEAAAETAESARPPAGEAGAASTDGTPADGTPAEGRPAPPTVTGFPALADGLAEGGRFALLAPAQPVPTAEGAWLPAWSTVLADCAAAVHARGESAVLVVPDHRDLDQLAAALALRLPAEPVARLDAAQRPAARYRAFLDAKAGRARLVIGNRSALLAPVPRLGLIAVWDEADPLLEEPHAPYPQARDIALLRQELDGAALVLAAHSRSAEVQRLVGLGWLQEAVPSRAYRPRVVLSERQPEGGPGPRVPPGAYAALRDGLVAGPVLVQVARPPGPEPEASAAAAPVAPQAPDVLRTARELGLAFPKAKVVPAHGSRPVGALEASPAIVVATRGSEPFAEGGYRAVVLLDGRRMLARESLRVAEDCLRWWANAAALAAPGAPVVLAGVDGPVADAFATWALPAFAAAELADRRALGFPPAVRTLRLHGPIAAVRELAEELQQRFGATPLRPPQRADGAEEALLRFDYRYGGEVAAEVKAAMIRAATGRRRPASRPGLPLKARFDEREPFQA